MNQRKGSGLSYLVCKVAYYINKTDCDWSNGAMIIYQITETKNNKWYVRIKRNIGKGYYRKCLNTVNKAFALKEAYDVWLKFLISENLDIPFGKSGFNTLWQKFIKEGGIHSEGRKSRIRDTGNKYFIPFFNEMDVMKINNKVWRKYLEWRRDYWGRRKEMGLPMPTVYKLVPTYSTYHSERQILIQFLSYCVKFDYLHKVPILDKPEKAQEIVGRVEEIGVKQTGTSIPMVELNKIKRRLRKYAYETKDSNRARSLARYRLYYFVMICYSSLLRPTVEMTGLKWSMITIEEGGVEGAFIGAISSNLGKWKSNQQVGDDRKRDAVLSYGGVKYLIEWREILKSLNYGVDKDDWVFPDYKGEHCNSHLIGRTFLNCLKNWGMRRWNGDKLNNDDGTNITLYSVRHSAITEMIKAGKDIGMVSTASDTSILQISKTYYREYIFKKKDRFANRFGDGEEVFVPKGMEEKIIKSGMKIKGKYSKKSKRGKKGNKDNGK